MDLSFGQEYEAFRLEVRTFLTDRWQPGDRRGKEFKDYCSEFRRAATDLGYLYRAIPRQYGGSEQPIDVLSAQIIREEFGRARAPMEVAGNGMNMLVPTLLECGTEAQKEKFVRPTMEGRYLWAQGYSEPGAGSDLASLRTRAELVGDKWIINGQKIWTSHADKAHYMFALVRTEPDATAHGGISYLLLDMRQPGVTVRPLKAIAEGSRFAEVFFDNAEAPADWLVGERGQGWKVSRTTLKHERASIGSAARSEGLFNKLLAMAKRGDTPAIENSEIRQKLAALEGWVMAQKYTAYRQLSLVAAGQEPVGRLKLMDKLVSTEIGHESARIAQELIDEKALLMPEDPVPGVRRGDEKWIDQILGSLGVSIAGGTSNIQRNIIAERGLGLPRDKGER